MLRRAEQLIGKALDAMSRGHQKACIELLGAAAECVVEAGGTSTMEWFHWPTGLPDGAMHPRYVERTVELSRHAEASLSKGRLTDVLGCIHDATLSAICANTDRIEAQEQAEEAEGVALRFRLVAEAETLASSPGSGARKRFRQLRSQWNDAPWMVDDVEYRALATRFNRAAYTAFSPPSVSNTEYGSPPAS